MRRPVTAVAVVVLLAAGCSSATTPAAAPADTATPAASTPASPSPTQATGPDPGTCTTLAAAWSAFTGASASGTTLSQEFEAAHALETTVLAVDHDPATHQLATDLDTLTGAILLLENADAGIASTPTADAQSAMNTDAAKVRTDHDAITAACG